MTKTIRKTLLIAISIASLGIGACGGDASDSGIDRSKKATSLSADERMSFCTWTIAVSGGEGKTTKCSDGHSVTVKTEAACVADFGTLPASCQITVGQAEDCTKAQAADPCNGYASAACAPLIACATGS